MNKNAYKLKGLLAKNAYDWWWHSFTGRDAETGELKPFFIEYYVINPALWKGKKVFGQLKENSAGDKRPCYAMIKAGSWGSEKAQIHNFFDMDACEFSYQKLDCRLGQNILSENFLKGEVIITKEECLQHPEYMTDAGHMKWELQVNKKLSYDVGYGSSKIFSSLAVFRMFWHVQGMMSEFHGTVEFNGRKYIVEPETSYGYQDKNWGRDYTNPWIWLNCNNFVSQKTGEKVTSSLDVGGGCPVVLGIPLKRKILTAFYYEGRLYEFNFSKFWKYSKQYFHVSEDETHINWEVISESSNHLLEIKMKCRKDLMLLVNYENPKGEKHHRKLWNGGHAQGMVKFYKKGKKLELIDELRAEYGGCEYGEY